MAPILATEPQITRTAEPDVAAADLALLDDVRPVPAGHCYRCGLVPCLSTSPDTTVEDDGTCNRDLAEPLTLDTWLSLAVPDALRGVFGTGFPLADLDPDARRLTADLVHQLGERVASRY